MFIVIVTAACSTLSPAESRLQTGSVPLSSMLQIHLPKKAHHVSGGQETLVSSLGFLQTRLVTAPGRCRSSGRVSFWGPTLHTCHHHLHPCTQKSFLSYTCVVPWRATAATGTTYLHLLIWAWPALLPAPVGRVPAAIPLPSSCSALWTSNGHAQGHHGAEQALIWGRGAP